jgi:hypothetical protein
MNQGAHTALLLALQTCDASIRVCETLLRTARDLEDPGSIAFAEDALVKLQLQHTRVELLLRPRIFQS